jgi:hypothetical protein
MDFFSYEYDLDLDEYDLDLTLLYSIVTFWSHDDYKALIKV